MPPARVACAFTPLNSVGSIMNIQLGPFARADAEKNTTSRCFATAQIIEKKKCLMQICRGPRLINFGACTPAGEKRRNIGTGLTEKFFSVIPRRQKKRRHRRNKKYVPLRPLDQLGRRREREEKRSGRKSRLIDASSLFWLIPTWFGH